MSIILKTSCTSSVFVVHSIAGLQSNVIGLTVLKYKLKILVVEVLRHLLDTSDLK